jgi:hypothetical protein
MKKEISYFGLTNTEVKEVNPLENLSRQHQARSNR